MSTVAHPRSLLRRGIASAALTCTVMLGWRALSRDLDRVELTPHGLVFVLTFTAGWLACVGYFHGRADLEGAPNPRVPRRTRIVTRVAALALPAGLLTVFLVRPSRTHVIAAAPSLVVGAGLLLLAGGLGLWMHRSERRTRPGPTSTATA
ncbi:hypothetical protein ACIBKX_24185 [Streptomyces sp. NPDC050658]|uniref:hypothetical protein n=1 Tax=unclassified Streptomyces TaxID=2593676 RepID=UPI00344A550F